MVALPACGAVYPRYTTALHDAPAGLAEGGELSPPPDDVQRIAVVRADVPRTTRDGRPWDGDGAPDPYVLIFRNGAEVFRSRVLPNTFDAAWNPDRDYVDLRVRPDDELRVELHDNDPIVDDVVGIASLRGVPEDARNGGAWGVRLEGGATVELRATPPPPRLGMGVTFDYRGDALGVVSVEPAGPAHAAGLREGDRIVALDGRPVASLGEGTAREAMDRGATVPVVLTVARGGQRTDLTVQRDAVYPAR